MISQLVICDRCGRDKKIPNPNQGFLQGENYDRVQDPSWHTMLHLDYARPTQDRNHMCPACWEVFQKFMQNRSLSQE